MMEENIKLLKIPDGEKMSETLFIRLKSYRDDGKFVENETDEELTIEEAIKVVQECWRDMPMAYYSWDLEKIIIDKELQE